MSPRLQVEPAATQRFPFRGLQSSGTQPHPVSGAGSIWCAAGRPSSRGIRKLLSSPGSRCPAPPPPATEFLSASVLPAQLFAVKTPQFPKGLSLLIYWLATQGQPVDLWSPAWDPLNPN